MGLLPCPTRRVSGRADAAALTAGHGHDGLIPRDPGGSLGAAAGGHGLDGELVVRERNRLAFERLQQRLARRGAAAAQAAREWSAHFTAFDRAYRCDDVTGRPYARRRAALEALFAERGLTAPWVLCPVDDRPGRGARVAVVDGGRSGGTVHQAAERALSRGRAVVWEVQGASHHRGPDRRGHRVPHRAPHAAARPLRPRGPPAVCRPQHHPVPGRAEPWPTNRPHGRTRIRGRAGRGQSGTAMRPWS